jgi:dihydroxyacid dehydratase/phosphogluconate dehydratase
MKVLVQKRIVDTKLDIYVFVYGGTIQPGKGHTDVVSVFEALGQFASNTISEIELENIEKTAIPIARCYH